MPEKAPTGKPARSSTPPPAQLTFRAIQDPELSPRACQVLWALTYWAWGTKADCWPSNRQIARLIGCSPRTVQLRILELAQAGYIWRKMEKTPHGWHRVLTITERFQAKLTLVGEGGATDCATPPEGGAGSCATPMKPVAPPLAQPVAHQRFEELEGRERELAEADEPKGKGSPPPEPEEPEFLRHLDNLTEADIEGWRKIEATTNHPLGRIARLTLARWARKETPQPPTKNAEGSHEDEASCHRTHDSTQNGRSGQEEGTPIKHNRH